MASVEKTALLQAFIAELAAELARAKAQAEDAAQGATHVENRAEGIKDMRSTEASYVARGHAERARQLELSLAKLSAMEVLDLEPSDAIKISALVELEEGVRMLGELRGVEPSDVAIGSAVQVEFVRIDDDLTLPVWRAVG